MLYVPLYEKPYILSEEKQKKLLCVTLTVSEWPHRAGVVKYAAYVAALWVILSSYSVFFFFFTSVQLSTQARLATPSAYSHRAADPETAGLTSHRLQGQHTLHMSFVARLMNQNETNEFFYILRNTCSYSGQKVR